jgi:hypothetical protein
MPQLCAATPALKQKALADERQGFSVGQQCS